MSYERAWRNVARWGGAVARVVLPCPCLGCGAEMENPRAPGLCEGCHRQLIPAPPTTCGGCGRPIDGRVPEPARCGRCRSKPPAWDQLRWGWVYRPPLDAVIMGLKFRRLDYLGARLGHDLALRLVGTLPPIDVVAAVPLHWSRRLYRGYDQASLVARAVAGVLEKPLVSALRRHRRTAPQSHHDRAKRRQNLNRAFEPRLDLRTSRVLLVDDVLTTGATLEAATRTLRKAGAETVMVTTVARTPHPDELDSLIVRE